MINKLIIIKIKLKKIIKMHKLFKINLIKKNCLYSKNSKNIYKI